MVARYLRYLLISFAPLILLEVDVNVMYCALMKPYLILCYLFPNILRQMWTVINCSYLEHGWTQSCVFLLMHQYR